MGMINFCDTCGCMKLIAGNMLRCNCDNFNEFQKVDKIEKQLEDMRKRIENIETWIDVNG